MGVETIALRRLLILLLVCLPGLCAARHPATVASALAKVDGGGAVVVRVHFDVLAYALEQTPAEVSDEQMKSLLDDTDDAVSARLQSARSSFGRETQILVDGLPVPSTVSTFASVTDVRAYRKPSGEWQLPVMGTAVLTADIPKGSKTLSIRFPDTMATVILTCERPNREPFSQPVEGGNSSTPLPLEPILLKVDSPDPPPISRINSPKPATAHVASPVVQPDEGPSVFRMVVAGTTGTLKNGSVKQATERSKDGARFGPEYAPENEQPSRAFDPQVQQPEEPRFLSSFSGYVRMGATHILPYGLDHVLFVLGLFLMSTRAKDLLKQITAFTIAHSMTLALSFFNVVRLPSHVVEPIIAGSIVVIALENLISGKITRWRVYVVFAFGLIHGMGFAGALQDTGLARGDFLTALIGFNLGVELGQLAVVGLAYLAVGWLQRHRAYRPLVVMPASAVIALTAAVWAVQRII